MVNLPKNQVEDKDGNNIIIEANDPLINVPELKMDELYQNRFKEILKKVEATSKKDEEEYKQAIKERDLDLRKKEAFKKKKRMEKNQQQSESDIRPHEYDDKYGNIQNSV